MENSHCRKLNSSIKGIGKANLNLHSSGTRELEIIFDGADESLRDREPLSQFAPLRHSSLSRSRLYEKVNATCIYGTPATRREFNRAASAGVRNQTKMSQNSKWIPCKIKKKIGSFLDIATIYRPWKNKKRYRKN